MYILEMYSLFIVLLFPLTSLGVDSELNIETGDGNSLQLSGYRSHEEFYAALLNQIGIKVRNATQATLAHGNQNVDRVLGAIDYMEYTFLQIFHSLSREDVTFTNQLLELYSTFDRQLRFSDDFRSQVIFLTEPTYNALNLIVNLGRKGLKSIPDDVVKGILSFTNISSVYYEASRRANIGVLKWLQQYVSNTERYTALETAWQQHRDDIVRMLIKSNITFVKPDKWMINGRNKNKESILHLAVELDNPQLVTLLLENGANVNIADANGTTPLLKAVNNNDIITAKLLIEKKADVNAATKLGYIPLHEAVRNGNHEMVKLLLDSGSTVCKETDQGITPLLISEKYVFREIIEYLFWSNSITVKQLPKDLRYLYSMTSYEPISRTKRSWKIKLNHILEQSMIANELILRGEKGYIPKDMKSKVLYLLMKLGMTKMARSMLNINAPLNPKKLEAKLIFRDAILDDNHELVAFMLSEGMSEDTDIRGVSALQVAADHGSVTIFNLLINRGADVTNIKDYNGSILHSACWGGKESIVRYLLENGSRVDSLDTDGNTPLSYAALFGFSEILKLLLDYKANPNAINNDMESALHQAAYGNSAEAVEILIKKDAEIEPRNKDGETPLFIAAKLGSAAALAILLKARAAVDAKDSANRTPLEISILKGHVNTTRLLLENGASPNSMDTQSRTSLHLAVSSGKIELVELILEKGVIINTQDSHGRNALHEAVANKALSIVQLLVSSRISINAKDKDGRTPLDYAISNCSPDIVSFLVKNRAKGSKLADPKCVVGD
nr:ankyrin-3 [Halyomorpha halys]